jgi:hypothetical protein
MLDRQRSSYRFPSDVASEAMRRIISRYVAALWLLAALSLVGWLLVNLDTAGWILIVLTVGLMTWELTTRKGGKGDGGGRARSFGQPDDPS